MLRVERLVAVRVRVPAVLRVTGRMPVPLLSAVFAGKAALMSEEVMPTESPTVGTTFQFASTALTVTAKGVPAVCAEGEPLLPVALPGEALSPGTRSCNLVKPPALTGMAALVPRAMAEWVTLEAVRVALPLVLSVTLNWAVPSAKGAEDGNIAFVSEEVMLTVS